MTTFLFDFDGAYVNERKVATLTEIVRRLCERGYKAELNEYAPSDASAKVWLDIVINGVCSSIEIRGVKKLSVRVFGARGKTFGEFASGGFNWNAIIDEVIRLETVRENRFSVEDMERHLKIIHGDGVVFFDGPSVHHQPSKRIVRFVDYYEAGYSLMVATINDVENTKQECLVVINIAYCEVEKLCHLFNTYAEHRPKQNWERTESIRFLPVVGCGERVFHERAEMPDIEQYRRWHKESATRNTNWS